MTNKIEKSLEEQAKEWLLNAKSGIDIHLLENAYGLIDSLLSENTALKEKLGEARMIALWAAIDLDHYGHKAEGERVKNQLNGLDFLTRTSPKEAEGE
jgi:hypothetical protein